MSSTVYSGSFRKAQRACQEDPMCVGFSRTHLFFSNEELKRGTPLYTVRDGRGNESYVKDLYPTVFL
jgi:hypothetical protein